MRILVTGGAGYLGSVLVPELLAHGHDVTVLDNLMFRQTAFADYFSCEQFSAIGGDARDERVLKPLVERADVIIPLAALVGAPLCNRDAIGTESVNFEAVRLLVRLASPQQRIIYPTTNSGYGIGERDAMCTEDSPLRPISTYGVTKVKAEQAVLERAESVTVRLATVFGMSPRMRLDLLVNDFVHRALRDRAVVLFEGHFRRNFVHIRDVARVFRHAIDNFATMKGRPYNVGLPEANMTKVELCATIRKHVPSFVFMEAPVGEDPDKRDYLVSNDRILGTGFRFEWGLDRGIKELVRGLRFWPTGTPLANV